MRYSHISISAARLHNLRCLDIAAYSLHWGTKVTEPFRFGAAAQKKPELRFENKPVTFSK
jgi:hypothetical protein